MWYMMVECGGGGVDWVERGLSNARQDISGWENLGEE